jgi:hypothetical protein
MPVWEAQYVIVISSRTGWSERFIRWELPLSRGWSYYHMSRVLDGDRMRWPEVGRKGNQFMSKLKSWARGLLKK